MSRDCRSADLERRDFERRKRTERSNVQRNNNYSSTNILDDMRSPLRSRAYGSNCQRETRNSHGPPRERLNYYQPSKRYFEKREYDSDNIRKNPDRWHARVDEFSVATEIKKIETTPETSKKNSSWAEMAEEEENAIWVPFNTEQPMNDPLKGILTPESMHKDDMRRSWSNVVAGKIEEEDGLQTSNGIKRQLDLCSISSSSSVDNQENRPRKKLEYETDTKVLARRQKQIDYGKNTASYIRYLTTVPRTLRSAKDPNTPVKHWKFSRRSWDSQVKIWKQKIHLWNPLTKTESGTCQSPKLDSILDTSFDIDLDLDLEMDTIPSSSVGSFSDGRSAGSLSDLRSNSSASDELTITDVILMNGPFLAPV